MSTVTISQPDATAHLIQEAAALSERTLPPGHNSRVGNTRFDDWLRNAADRAPRRDSHPVTEASHA